MDEWSRFLLDLYAAARELPPLEFRESAIGFLLSYVPGASAFWGEARRMAGTAAVLPTVLYNHRIDNDFVIDWAKVQPEDPMAPLLFANPGRALRVHMPTFYGANPLTVQIGRRYGLGSMTSILVPGVAPRQIHWLTLFRRNPDSPFSDRDAAWIEEAMPHLTEAWRINAALHPAGPPGGLDERDLAVADASTGAVLRADPGWLAMVGAEWPAFDGVSLPRPLREACDGPPSFVHLGLRARIDGRRAGGLLYLSARWKDEAESLTVRQLDVAQRFASGMSAKDIARAGGLSPSTVRNHLAHVYEALQVHSRIELGRRLDALLRSRPLQ